ncbi:MAG: hypothetical protein WC456_02965 [Patescibacteria group bacterium]
MFNDLNNPNNQGRPAVDDIFAETDKSADGAPTNSANAAAGIDTKHVGLTATDGMMGEAAERTIGNKWFKISLISIIAAIVILGAYLLYSKVFKASPDINSPATITPSESSVITPSPSENAPVAPAASDSGSFVIPTGDGITGSEVIPDIPGVNAPGIVDTATTVEDIILDNPVVPIDSDSDGLTDSEEQAAGTNINVIDTDNDGLSDYEEVKIYRTNPLSADTDGDSYLDGAEVKSGYDPNGTGKLNGVPDSVKSAE